MSIMKRLLCAVLLLGICATTAYADRRTGMRRSLLIEDSDDMFLFPNRMATYRNLISLDYGPSENAGNAVLTLGGGDAAYGFALHRGDLMDPYGVNTNPFGVTAQGALNDLPSVFSGVNPNLNQPPATMLDFLYARKLSGNTDFGLRLGLGRGSNVNTVANSDTGAEEKFLSLQGGFGSGVRGQTTRLDISLSLGGAMGQTITAGTQQTKGSRFNADALGRVFVPMDSQLDLGILGSLGARSVGVTNSTLNPSQRAAQTDFYFAGGLGPAFRFNKASVAGYALVRAQFDKLDGDTNTPNNETANTSLVLPGMHVAVEVPVADWFYLRSGAEYTFNVMLTSAPGANNGSSSNNGNFGWNAGFGIVMDQLRFDGALQQGFVTNGPNFIGGGNGFLAIASLTYSFDEARSKATAVGQFPAEPEPEVAAEPVQAAEPLPPPAPAAPR